MHGTALGRAVRPSHLGVVDDTMLRLVGREKGTQGREASVMIELEPERVADPGAEVARLATSRSLMRRGQQVRIDGGAESLLGAHTFMVCDCHDRGNRGYPVQLLSTRM